MPTTQQLLERGRELLKIVNQPSFSPTNQPQIFEEYQNINKTLQDTISKSLPTAFSNVSQAAANTLAGIALGEREETFQNFDNSLFGGRETVANLYGGPKGLAEYLLGGGTLGQKNVPLTQLSTGGKTGGTSIYAPEDSQMVINPQGIVFTRSNKPALTSEQFQQAQNTENGMRPGTPAAPVTPTIPQVTAGNNMPAGQTNPARLDATISQNGQPVPPLQNGGQFGTRSFARQGNDVFETTNGQRRYISSQEFQTDLQPKGLNLDVLPQLEASGGSSGTGNTGNTGGRTGQSGANQTNPQKTALETIASKFGLNISPSDFATNPFSSIKDLMKQVFESTGLGELKTQIETITKDIESLQNERDKQIEEINENPFISEAQRNREVLAKQKEYESKLENRTNRLKLLDGLNDDIRQQAQWAANLAVQEFQFQQNFQQKQLEFIAEQAEKETEAKRKFELELINEANKVKPGIVGEYEYYVQQEALAGRRPVSFNEYQNLDANRRRSITNVNVNGAGLTSQQVNAAFKLSDDYVKASGDFTKVRDAYNRVVASAKNPSAAGDLALIFNYMKMLDPGSTVRESEFATAQNAGSIPERVRAQYNKAVSGERLSDAIRKDFVSRAQTLYSSASSQQKQIDNQFKKRATDFGIPSDLVITNQESFIPQLQQFTGQTSTGLKFKIIP